MKFTAISNARKENRLYGKVGKKLDWQSEKNRSRTVDKCSKKFYTLHQTVAHVAFPFGFVTLKQAEERHLTSSAVLTSVRSERSALSTRSFLKNDDGVANRDVFPE